jgi:phosphatidate cytidylyltransferase
MNNSPWGGTPYGTPPGPPREPGWSGPPPEEHASAAQGRPYGASGPYPAADDGATTLLPPVPDPYGANPEDPVASPHPEPLPDEPVDGPVPAPLPPRPKKKGRSGRNLPAAIGVGVGLGGAIVVALLTFKVLFVGVVIAAMLVGLWELSGALTGKGDRARGIRLPLVPLAVGSVAMQIAAYVKGPEGLAIAAALTALAVMVWRMTEGPEDYLRDMTAGVFAVFYLPFLAGFATLMLAEDQGAQRVLTFMILVVCADTGAFAAGFNLGKHKMAPKISPGKTWEGLAGAVLTSALAGALCVHYMLDGAWWQGAVLGAVVAVVSAVGDLLESMIKRDLGVKDMGTLLPGHGGVLDRLDSLVAAAPVVWLLLAAFIGT